MLWGTHTLGYTSISEPSKFRGNHTLVTLNTLGPPYIQSAALNLQLPAVLKKGAVQTAPDAIQCLDSYRCCIRICRGVCVCVWYLQCVFICLSICLSISCNYLI